jgi:acyl-CoA reductase-like NAD-dependent aldehyde dehydrogenase
LTTNQPPPTVAVPATNVSANAETNLPPPVATVEPTNAPLAPPANFVAPAMAVQTNAVVPPPENSGLSSKRGLVIGAVFLVLAGVLTVLLLGRSRKAGHGSLITRSMNQKK